MRWFSTLLLGEVSVEVEAEGGRSSFTLCEQVYRVAEVMRSIAKECSGSVQNK